MRYGEPLSENSAMTLKRLLKVTTATALAAVALTACGSEQAGGRQRHTANTVDAQAAAGRDSDAQVAFIELLERVGAPCVPDAPATTRPGDPDPSEHPPTRPGELLPVDEKPPTDVPSPTAAPEQPKLNAVEACEGREHGKRITQALAALKTPTTAQVRQRLNELGYIDSRVHGLEARRDAVRFFLDLRVMGGQLALEGAAAGKETTVEAFAYPAEGAFTPGD